MKTISCVLRCVFLSVLLFLSLRGAAMADVLDSAVKAKFAFDRVSESKGLLPEDSVLVNTPISF